MMVKKNDAQDEKDAKVKRKPKKISWTNPMYEKVFEFIAQEDPLVIRRDAAQIPRGALVLSGLATPIRSVDVEGLKVTTTKPQNCVVAMVNGIPRYGIVKQIYSFSDHKNEERTVVILSPITNMFPKRFNVPTTRFRYYLYLYKAVVGKVKYEEALVVAPSAIQSVAAYRMLPPKVFGIEKDGIILVPYDHCAALNISGEGSG
jgi:hypothetical protein